jgi:predicted transcriptional regulator
MPVTKILKFQQDDVEHRYQVLRDRYECQQAGVQDLLQKIEQLTLDNTALKDSGAKLVQDMTESLEKVMKKLQEFEESVKKELEDKDTN